MHFVQDVAEDLPVVEKGGEEEIPAEPEDGAFSEQAYDEHTQGLSHEERQLFRSLRKTPGNWRVLTSELKVVSRSVCQNAVATLFINECFFLLVCRKGSNSQSTTNDQPGLLKLSWKVY